MKKSLILMLLVFMCLVLVGCTSKENTKLKVGVVQWAQHPALQETYDGMVEKVKAELGEDVEIIHKVADDDASTAQMIVQGFIEDKVDVVYAIATPAAQTAKNLLADTDIPFVFNAVSDPVEAGLVESWAKPNINGTGISDVAPMEKQLELIKEMLPNATKVGVLYNTGEANSLVQIEELVELAPKVGIDIVMKGVSSQSDISLVGENLSKEVDAFYIITDNMIANAAPLVVDLGNRQNIPVFMAEATQIENGVLASESISYFELGEQAGQMIVDILVNGKQASEMAVGKADKTQLVINKSVSEKLNIELPDSIVERAEFK